MPKPLSRKERSFSSDPTVTNNKGGARARFDDRDNICVYTAQGDVTCNKSIKHISSSLTRSPDFQGFNRDDRNLGSRLSDAVHMRQPTVSFTYNPHICCRGTCSRVAPCSSVDADINQPNSKCSACQKGLCNSMC